MTSKHLIVTGVLPGDGGAGSFINYIKNKNAKLFYVNYFSNNKFLNSVLNRFKIYDIISFLKSNYLIFILKNNNINKNIIFFHPQSIGYFNFKLLTKKLNQSKKNKMFLYVIDNSFFCVKSYNYLKENNAPSCFKCADNLNSYKNFNCKSFPLNSNKNNRLSSLINYLVKSEKIELCFQNILQFKIAKSIYGFNFKYKIVGLWTDEYNLFKNEINTKLNDTGFNIVYHGSAHEAKGFLWALELACNTPSLSFLFPINILNVPENYHNLKNCKFIDCQWETGLKYYCEQADAVIVPSLWSACIESALIKSLLIAKRVIVVENKTAYYNEIPIALYYEIKYNIEEASEQIQKVIENPVIDNITRKKWFADFKNFNSMVFDKLTE